ncbi:uncharacterized protein N7529_011091 [Penicillium soppii]|uniref:uncharacterized protein n=1 Tax=Penicillium soppii TaxID=69789 RepID=UPI0025488234|nr:uncharacterized protein N7529_011091 [Penicillium soppii]KAJ5851706.1 hypothetical protein N7529_011091 [Penicillium soppii]
MKIGGDAAESVPGAAPTVLHTIVLWIKPRTWVKAVDENGYKLFFGNTNGDAGQIIYSPALNVRVCRSFSLDVCVLDSRIRQVKPEIPQACRYVRLGQFKMTEK